MRDNESNYAVFFGRIYSPSSYSMGPLVEGLTKDQVEMYRAAPDLYDACDSALNTLIACAIPAGGIDDRKAILESQRILRAALAKAKP